jgi:hypothetical protein
MSLDGVIGPVLLSGKIFGPTAEDVSQRPRRRMGASMRQRTTRKLGLNWTCGAGGRWGPGTSERCVAGWRYWTMDHSIE